MIMNELDEELTRRNLKTIIVFICYVDTTYPPVTETIKNPERFSLLVALITRTYLTRVPNEVIETEMDKYICNKLVFAKYGRRTPDIWQRMDYKYGCKNLCL